ncbi:sensor histidine kinase [Tenacibaculum agarivorans]|uniref:sensor histidine kinase n=1 Tax=Tenacibaculum agarivorans TaxID=1908389 RepID=UPI000A7A43F4|nr:histidine kinase [Tenacibaculum agarivorans]
MNRFTFVIMEMISKIIDFVKKNRIVKHILFWTFLFSSSLIQDLIILNDKDLNLEIKDELIYNSCGFIVKIVASYFIVYFWIPKYIKTKKYFLAIIIFCVVIYLLAVISRILIVYVAEPLTIPHPFNQESILEILTQLKWLFKKYIPNILLSSSIFIAFKFFLDEGKEKEKKLKLAKEKAEIELKTLKGQLNPHFLFNTLNNIYSLSIDNSPKTSNAIAKLSEILDQVLYKSDHKLVPLQSELTLIENYIELEKLRYDERLQISINTNIIEEVDIPPLILLSLVENAFKHGAGEDDGSPTITIAVESYHKKLVFCVKNSVSKYYQSQDKKTIGLLNIRKQLDLIYSTNYNLDIDQTSDEFSVTLTITP